MRTKCTAEGCTARKPNHKMYEVKRSRADPTVIGYACSRPCAAKVLAADPGPVIRPLAKTWAESCATAGGNGDCVLPYLHSGECAPRDT